MTPPVLNSALRRLWRTDGTLQLGIEPPHAVVIEGLTSADEPLLDLLSGSSQRRRPHADAPHDDDRLGSVVDVLRAAGALAAESEAPAAPIPQRLEPDALALSLVHPGRSGAAVIRARAARRVDIRGAGRLGASIATLLAASGVGEVRCFDPASPKPGDLAPGGLRDCYRSTRGEAANALVEGWQPPAARDGHPPDLVVIAPVATTVDPQMAAACRTRPHVEVGVRETVARIGPLVIPGLTPCRRCAEIRRADRDPDWPWLCAQLSSPPSLSRQRAPNSASAEPSDTGLAALASALAAIHVLRWLDDRFAERHRRDDAVADIRTDLGRHPLVGGVLEFSLVDLRLRRRTISAHPECGCGATAAA